MCALWLNSKSLHFCVKLMKLLHQQETEIPCDYPENVLNCKGYNVELELNSVKKRVCIYVHKDINYTRRSDLEKENHHIVILDVKCKTDFRVVTLYRSFRPQGGISPVTFLNAHLVLLSRAVIKTVLYCVISTLMEEWN